MTSNHCGSSDGFLTTTVRSDPQITATANWHSSYIDDFSAGGIGLATEPYSTRGPTLSVNNQAPLPLDIRTLQGYQDAKNCGSLVATEPSINPDTGYPIKFSEISDLRNGEFIGCATPKSQWISCRFLTRYRPSAHSTTIIADPTDGKIIANSDRQKSVSAVDGRTGGGEVENIADDDVREPIDDTTRWTRTSSSSVRPRPEQSERVLHPVSRRVLGSHGRWSI